MWTRAAVAGASWDVPESWPPHPAQPALCPPPLVWRALVGVTALTLSQAVPCPVCSMVNCVVICTAVSFLEVSRLPGESSLGWFLVREGEIHVAAGWFSVSSDLHTVRGAQLAAVEEKHLCFRPTPDDLTFDPAISTSLPLGPETSATLTGPLSTFPLRFLRNRQARGLDQGALT